MDHDKSFLGNLSLSLFENAQRRSRHWEYFFKKYSRTDTKNNLSFTFSELSDDIEDDIFNLDQAEHYTNRTVLINPSPYELKITDQIENKLQSQLNKYILIREKTKQLLMPECYEVIHKVVKKEVRRLKKYCLSEDIEKYICLSVTPKEGVQDFIERELQSDIKMLVINQFKVLGEPHDDYKMWNMKLIAEFEHLTKVLPEEDVIKYMTYVLRH